MLTREDNIALLTKKMSNKSNLPGINSLKIALGICDWIPYLVKLKLKSQTKKQFAQQS